MGFSYFGLKKTDLKKEELHDYIGPTVFSKFIWNDDSEGLMHIASEIIFHFYFLEVDTIERAFWAAAGDVAAEPAVYRRPGGWSIFQYVGANGVENIIGIKKVGNRFLVLQNYFSDNPEKAIIELESILNHTI